MEDASARESALVTPSGASTIDLASETSVIIKI
jgi:hypothetical protein